MKNLLIKLTHHPKSRTEKKIELPQRRVGGEMSESCTLQNTIRPLLTTLYLNISLISQQNSAKTLLILCHLFLFQLI